MFSGHYSEGERLLSQHRMARAFDVAFNTFRAALGTLESEGYMARRVGDGTFAVKPGTANTGANRVLAIDDEPHTRELIRAALSRLGFQVDVARNSHEALVLMEDSPYQGLILDLKMPGMSGKDLFGIITRNQPALAERVLFVTGDTVSPQTRDFLASTGRPWLNKPVHLQDLAGEVAMVCEAESALEQSRPQGAGR